MQIGKIDRRSFLSFRIYEQLLLLLRQHGTLIDVLAASSVQSSRYSVQSPGRGRSCLSRFLLQYYFPRPTKKY